MAGTTSDKLHALVTSKEGIRLAIESQGVDCGTDVPFSEYAQKILSISGGSGGVAQGAVGLGGGISGYHVNIAGPGQFVKVLE